MHKHPNRFQSVELSVGKAHVFYPECSDDLCTAALLLDVDPVDMVRGGKNLYGKEFSLGNYVNDRPYVASSFMSSAMSKAFSSAMNGNCKDKPELVDLPIPLKAVITSLPAPKGGEILIRKMFEPLGYEVQLERQILDAKFDTWGYSKYFKLELKHKIPLQELLTHLYVLIPALDLDKHYFIARNEIEKLLEKGKGWLEKHPEKEQITRRYLLNFRSLTRQALERLDDKEEEREKDEPEEIVQRKESLHKQRLNKVFDHIKASGANKVIDLGCGEGKLLRMLLKDKQFTSIAGVDISFAELQKAKGKLYWDNMAPKQKERISLFQGSLTYRDKRFSGYDVAALVEVIEHLDLPRLKAFEKVVFGHAKPGMLIITTPNAEYNELYESLNKGQMRHSDHRFEWTRAEFKKWTQKIANRYHYLVEVFPIGEIDEKLGSPSQMAVFTYEN